tara:strand:- start:178 stop:465 length:288 start_codon:yes stop_codon:yes gene_type:complete
MHAKNLEPDDGEVAAAVSAGKGYLWGNPFSLLKLQMVRLDPLSSQAEKDEALAQAWDLGLDLCTTCPGCKCGVGIDLKNKVVKKLLDATGPKPGA